jgi:hypothetical protein
MTGADSVSDELNADRFRSLATLDHIDGHSLAFHQIGEAAAVERRDMHENVFTAAVADDEPKSFVGIVPLHRADLRDSSLISRLIRPLRPGAPRLLLQRRAGIDAQDFGDCSPF